jgi:hypothetical protein
MKFTNDFLKLKAGGNISGFGWLFLLELDEDKRGLPDLKFWLFCVSLQARK